MRPSPARHGRVPSGWRKWSFRLFVAGMCAYVAGTVAGFVLPSVGAGFRVAAVVLLAGGLPWAAQRTYCYFRDRLFFRVRNRVLVFYFFAGVVPIALIALICVIGIYLFLINLSVFIYDNELKTLSMRLSSLNAGLAETLYNAPESVEDPDTLHELFQGVLTRNAPDLPPTNVLLYQVSDTGEMVYSVVESSLDWRSFGGEYLPDWLHEVPFSGTVLKNFSMFVYSHNIVRLGDRRYFLDVFIPFGRPLFRYLLAKADLRAAVTIESRSPSSGGSGWFISYPPFNGFKGTPAAPLSEFERDPEQMFPGQGSEDFLNVSATNTFETTDWFSREKPSVEAGGKDVLVHLRTPLRTIVEYMSSKTPAGKFYYRALLFFVYVFFAIQALSIFIGVLVIRSFTRSVYELSKGTNELMKGNFNVRIPVHKRDELGELSRSFNAMSASVYGLLREVADKQRIMRELEIARQVQQEFFPKTVPVIPGLVVDGECRPAREVSGDFYDFIPRNHSQSTDILVGDISGKGISAALLMASLQSACRAQAPPAGGYDGMDSECRQVGSFLGALNRHLFAITPPEKFATLFYGRFFHLSGTFLYCNAGHEAPVLVRADGSVERLDLGGMVVGAFPEAEYEINCTQINPGDFMAIYTDGLLEASNRAGEEYGYDRLLARLAALRHLQPREAMDAVLQDVTSWYTGVPQHDDITLVVLKGTPPAGGPQAG